MLTREQKINIITQAIALISDPDKWTSHNFSINAIGEVVSSWHEEAIAWCALGAIEKFTCAQFNFIPPSPPRCYYESLGSFKKEIDNFCESKKYNYTLILINDKLGREKVIEVLQEYLKVIKEQNAN